MQPTLRALDYPNHWLLLERIKVPIARTRYEFLFAYVQRGELGPGKLEQNIIHTDGIPCHYVTDVSQPLHTTVHIFGRNAPSPFRSADEQPPPSFPNPKGYIGQDIHRRFESYADASVPEADLLQRIGPPRLLGDWLDEAMRHISQSHDYVDDLYGV
jgi:hypothetical protein